MADPYAAERDGKSFASVLQLSSAQRRPDSFRIGVHMEMIVLPLFLDNSTA